MIGLAPSAAAAEALGNELVTATENTAQWLTEHRRVPDLIAAYRRVAASFGTTGPGAKRLRRTLAKMDQEIDARRFHDGQLVIMDEASLAGTLALDELVAAAGRAGAKVLLVGDWAQLGAVEAGGGFGLLVRDRGDLAANSARSDGSPTTGRPPPASVCAAATLTRSTRTRAHERIVDGRRDEILEAGSDGSLIVQRFGGDGWVSLPAGYVAQHVELGYATTVHQAQGRTVDTAHAIINPTTTRETLYVAATRGRDRNQLYVDTQWDPDPETAHGFTDGIPNPAAVLQRVMANAGAELSATETIRSQAPPARHEPRDFAVRRGARWREDGELTRQASIEL